MFWVVVAVFSGAAAATPAPTVEDPTTTILQRIGTCYKPGCTTNTTFDTSEVASRTRAASLTVEVSGDFDEFIEFCDIRVNDRDVHRSADIKIRLNFFLRIVCVVRSKL